MYPLVLVASATRGQLQRVGGYSSLCPSLNSHGPKSLWTLLWIFPRPGAFPQFLSSLTVSQRWHTSCPWWAPHQLQKQPKFFLRKLSAFTDLPKASSLTEAYNLRPNFGENSVRPLISKFASHQLITHRAMVKQKERTDPGAISPLFLFSLSG